MTTYVPQTNNTNIPALDSNITVQSLYYQNSITQAAFANINNTVSSNYSTLEAAIAAIPPPPTVPGFETTTILDVGSTELVGSTGLIADGGHVHRGVHSLILNDEVYGDLTIGGSCATQSTQAFSFFPYGVPKSVSPSYTVLTSDTFLVVTPTGGGQTLQLLTAASYPAGWCLRIHSGSAANGFVIALVSGDHFNGNATGTYQINPLGSTAYIGTMLVSDGVSNWYTQGYN